MEFNCPRHGVTRGTYSLKGKPYCPRCYSEHPMPEPDKPSESDQRLLNIEHNLNTLLDKVGPQCPGRVECPTCGTVKNLGAVVLQQGEYTTICDGCNETLVILVQVMEQPKEEL